MIPSQLCPEIHKTDAHERIEKHDVLLSRECTHCSSLIWIWVQATVTLTQAFHQRVTCQ